MFSEENIMQTLIAGSGISALLALAIAGQWQEMKFKRLNQAQIEEDERGMTQYQKRNARMALSSTVIRKGHE